ncbi:MAG: hypothetical protein IPF54_13190 [Draconibacterium sp.]|nr:hypothetical protein [Draconibacterium sp.]
MMLVVLVSGHTTGTGTNRLMMVGYHGTMEPYNQNISSVTFTPTGGSAVGLLEVITQLGYNSTNPRYSAIYSLLNPASGQAGTVTVTFSGSVTNGIMAGAANFAGVDQTTPLGTPSGASGTSSASPSLTLSGLNGNELVFDNVFQGRIFVVHADGRADEHGCGIGLRCCIYGRLPAPNRPQTFGIDKLDSITTCSGLLQQ